MGDDNQILQVLIQFRADIENAKKEILEGFKQIKQDVKLDDEASGWDAFFEKLAGYAGTFFSLHAILSILKGDVKEFANQQESVLRLENTFKALNIPIQGNIEGVNNLAADLRGLGFTTNETLDAYSRFLLISKDTKVAMDATALAARLVRTGFAPDLASAVQQLTLIYAGAIPRQSALRAVLTETRAEIEKGVPSVNNLTQAIDEANRKLPQASTASDSLAIAQKSVGAELKQTAADTGRTISNFLHLKEVYGAVAEAIHLVNAAREEQQKSEGEAPSTPLEKAQIDLKTYLRDYAVVQSQLRTAYAAPNEPDYKPGVSAYLNSHSAELEAQKRDLEQNLQNQFRIMESLTQQEAEEQKLSAAEREKANSVERRAQVEAAIADLGLKNSERSLSMFRQEMQQRQQSSKAELDSELLLAGDNIDAQKAAYDKFYTDLDQARTDAFQKSNTEIVSAAASLSGEIAKHLQNQGEDGLITKDRADAFSRIAQQVADGYLSITQAAEQFAEKSGGEPNIARSDFTTKFQQLIELYSRLKTLRISDEVESENAAFKRLETTVRLASETMKNLEAESRRAAETSKGLIDQNKSQREAGQIGIATEMERNAQAVQFEIDALKAEKQGIIDLMNQPDAHVVTQADLDKLTEIDRKLRGLLQIPISQPVDAFVSQIDARLSATKGIAQSQVASGKISPQQGAQAEIDAQRQAQTDILPAIIKLQTDLQTLEQSRDDLTTDQLTKMELEQDALLKLKDTYEKLTPTLQQQAAASNDIFAGFTTGLKNNQLALQSWGQEGMTIGNTVADQFSTAGSKAFLGWIEGSKNWLKSFRQMVSQILQLIAEMIIKMLIAKAIQSAIGGIGGFFGGGATVDATGGSGAPGGGAGIGDEGFGAASMGGVTKVSGFYALGGVSPVKGFADGGQSVFDPEQPMSFPFTKDDRYLVKVRGREVFINPEDAAYYGGPEKVFKAIKKRLLPKEVFANLGAKPMTFEDGGVTSPLGSLGGSGSGGSGRRGSQPVVFNNHLVVGIGDDELGKMFSTSQFKDAVDQHILTHPNTVMKSQRAYQGLASA